MYPQQHSLLIYRCCFQCRLDFRRNYYKFWEYWPKFDRWQDRVAKEEAELKKQTMLRRWLPNKSKFFRPMYITPEREEDGKLCLKLFFCVKFFEK